jgi:uncharacterized membrane protein YvlD (DUF360 family)
LLSGFVVKGFWAALLGALALSIVNALAQSSPAAINDDR